MPSMQSEMSPIFSLLNSKWKLEVLLANSQTAFHSAYQVSLKYISGLPPFPTLEMKTYLDHKEYNAQYRLASRPDGASATYDTLHKARFDSIFADGEDFERCNDIIVICIFNPSTELALSEEPKRDKSILLDCSLCQNRGCFIQNNLNQPPPDTEYPSTKLLSNFPSLSEDFSLLLNKCLLSDVKLRCEDVLIHAHRAILVARSQLFMAKLSVNNLNVNQIIGVNDIELSVLRLLLRYLYTRMIPDFLSEEIIKKLYVVSSTHRVESLRKMCRCFIVRNLRENNYANFMILALAHSDNELKNAISLFVIVNPLLMQVVSWENFSREFPKVAKEICNVFVNKKAST